MGPKRRIEDNLKDFASLEDDRTAIRECITKIMNTLSFRKLAGKTQVILSLSGPDIRTRLTHTIEVAKIAKDICIKLGLNADLAEAIALAHDIGHTPFGHVGERTLREIMCGCDTLRDRVPDCDFENSGFKHNLQSLRVLSNAGIFTNREISKIEPYILWGALTHSNMSWSKPYSGIEDEILISSKHCDWVYACYYHEKKECKRNIQHKIKIKWNEDAPQNRVCKPWYCAKLETVNKIDDVKPPDYVLDEGKGETRREYVKKGYFKKEYRDYIFCSRKCYLAKLWEHKINNNHISIEHPYLFDHPFPNSFYVKDLNSKFFITNSRGSWVDCISLEAQIVSQADEIAQRQQDLEDGIAKNLLTLDQAIEAVEELIKHFKGPEYATNLHERIKRPEELGKVLVDFYHESIVHATSRNIKRYSKLQGNREKINIYSLLNILYSISYDSKKKGKWLLKELKRIQIKNWSKGDFKNSSIGKHFDLDFKTAYLYLLAYDYLESRAKRFEYLGISTDILSETLNCLKLEKNKRNKALSELSALMDTLVTINRKKNPDELVKAYQVIILLDKLRDYLDKTFKAQSKDFFMAEEKKFCKQKGALNWPHLLVLFSIYKKFIHKDTTFSASELKVTGVDDAPQADFEEWKEALKYDADKALKNLVGFIPVDDTKRKMENKKDALKKFEEEQKNIILKSEAVEKNDGKAGYILIRLFKAYINNSHQLPDTGLKYILTSILKTENWKDLLESERNAFENILYKLRKTMINRVIADKKIDKIIGTHFLKTPNPILKKLKERTSNEVKAAIDNRIKLFDFLKDINESKRNVLQVLSSEKESDVKELKKILNKYRAVLDNSVLNATPSWKRILTRAICDYIASLTDQEAINEYERLYAGVMELV